MKITEAIPNLTLVDDIGDYSEGVACVMSAAVAEWRLLNDEPLGDATDELDCVCQAVRALAIHVNDGDWPSDAARTEWGLAMVPRILDTNDPDMTARRVRYLVMRAMSYAADALERTGLPEQAANLRALPDDVSYAAAHTAAAAAVHTDARAAAWAAARPAARAAARADAADADAAAAAVANAAANAARETVQQLLDDILDDTKMMQVVMPHDAKENR